jgi:hypothetical protein
MVLDSLSLTSVAQCHRLIRDKFVHDCMSGDRARVLPAGMYASGQYFDLPTRTQRGLHGTAAALRVTAEESSSGDATRRVARGIVNYLQHREETELTLATSAVRQRELTLDKLRHDRINTVKQAEVLRALSFVPHGLATSDDLKTRVSDQILAGQAQDGRGWAFILGSPQPSHVLPTAHVVRALAANGHPVNHWAASLARGLVGRSKETRTDYLAGCIDCFALQVLIEIEGLSRLESRIVLDSLWRILYRHLDTPREANVDFFDGDRQNFVRVPWQLHVVTCSAAIRPYRRYLSGEAQRTLQAVVCGVLDDDGFRYPESGEHLSTRTYAYIYDSLSLILGRRGGRYRPELLIAHLVTATDRPMRIALRLGRWALAIGAGAILVAGLAGWVRDGSPSVSGLAPNFVSAGVLLALSWFLRSRRKS